MRTEMRPIFLFLPLVASLAAACGQTISGQRLATSPSPASIAQPLRPTSTSPPASQSAATAPATPSPTNLFYTLPAKPTATSASPFDQGLSLMPDWPLIAYESGSAQNKILRLTDVTKNISFEFRFPHTARFATPLLAGLSPGARYFVYFEGGWLENLYDTEHLRASRPDLVIHVLDLHSGEIIFSEPLLSPSYPQNLAQIAEMIKDDWSFTNSDATFEDVVAATQEMMLDHIRSVAWSPDSSLLGFAAQNPGPSSDLYFFRPETRTTWRVTADPGHVLSAYWAPDSSALVMDTSLYNRHMREDTTYVLSRDGSILKSFTSQLWNFAGWRDPIHALFYSSTDSGDNVGVKAISAKDGTTTMPWEGSFGDIAFSPDLSSFLLGSNMPSAPIPPSSGLFLGRRDREPLLKLSEVWGWGVAYWGSERFAFAASSIDEGTVGVTLDGARAPVDDGYWNLAASPDGSYLAGYNKPLWGNLPGVQPGLRIFDGDGLALVSIDNINVDCVRWNPASTALAYQIESQLYLWDAVAGSSRLIADQLDQDDCAFEWVRDTP